MKRIILLLAFSAALGIVAFDKMSARQPTQSEQPNLFGPPQAKVPDEPRKPRQIRPETGVDILSRLAPDDSEVEVSRQDSPPLFVAAEPGAEIELHMRSSDVAALVEITQTRGVFSEKRDWISTVVEASVVEVMKDTQDRSLMRASKLEFTDHSGGELLGPRGVRVRAATSWVSSGYTVGKTYLMFLGVGPDGRLYGSPEQRYEVSPDAKLLSTVDAYQPCAGMSLSAVRADAEKTKNLPRFGAPR